MKRAKAAKLVASHFGAWHGILVRYAWSFTGDLDRAEDLVQDVFLRLYRGLRTGTEIRSPRAWLFCTLRNDILRQMRSARDGHRISEGLEGMQISETRPSLLPDAEVPEWQSDEIEEYFDLLSSREREVMILRMASLKYREIAERLDLTVSSVNTLLARAVRKVQAAAKKKDRRITDHVARRVPKTLQ